MGVDSGGMGDASSGQEISREYPPEKLIFQSLFLTHAQIYWFLLSNILKMKWLKVEEKLKFWVGGFGCLNPSP